MKTFHEAALLRLLEELCRKWNEQLYGRKEADAEWFFIARERMDSWFFVRTLSQNFEACISHDNIVACFGAEG